MSNGDFIRAQFDNELYHYGVPGMRWGHKRAATPVPTVSQTSTNRVVNNQIQAKKQMKDAKVAYKKANRQYNKAYRDSNSLILNSQFNRADNKRRNDAALKAAQKAENANKQYKKAKAKYKMSKKQANIAVKDIKKQYQKQYMAGENAVGKIYAKLTGSHKTYADMMYEINRNT